MGRGRGPLRRQPRWSTFQARRTVNDALFRDGFQRRAATEGGGADKSPALDTRHGRRRRACGLRRPAAWAGQPRYAGRRRSVQPLASRSDAGMLAAWPRRRHVATHPASLAHQLECGAFCGPAPKGVT
eukprot:365569-Chlamydomonas_euryale.AAC.16